MNKKRGQYSPRLIELLLNQSDELESDESNDVDDFGGIIAITLSASLLNGRLWR